MLVSAGDDGARRLLAAAAIPLTLEGSLLARLDRLTTGKSVAQIASVIGREFSYNLIADVADCDPQSLDVGLRELVKAGVLFVRGSGAHAEYIFKHALIHDAAYGSVLKSARRHYHHRVATALRARIPPVAERMPELAARHHTEAGDWDDATTYWLRAGTRAVQASANLEAITYLEQALECLEHVDPSPLRSSRELEILLALGPPLMATRGYADERVERGYLRAHAILDELGEGPELLPVKFGLWTYHCLRAKHVAGRELAERMTRRADELDDDGLRVEAGLALGANLFYLGEIRASAAALRRSLALYDTQAHAMHRFVYGQDPGVAAYAYEAFDLWLLGDPQSALASSRRGLELARTLDHPFSLTYALTFAAWFHRLRGDVATCFDLASELHSLASERQVALYRAVGRILLGSSTAELRSPDEGLPILESGLAEYERTGSSVIVPYWQALLADAYRRSGRIDEGLAAIESGLDTLAKTSEHWCRAELHRVRADLLDAAGVEPTAVLAEYDAAVAHATRDASISLALRAAVGACRYSKARARGGIALDRLAQIRADFADSALSEEIREADELIRVVSQ